MPPLARHLLRFSLPVTLEIAAAPPTAWPYAFLRTAPDFSYQFFDRISALASLTGEPPVLDWGKDDQETAADLRQRYSGHLYTAHLKNVAGQAERDSNAVTVYWREFLAHAAAPGRAEFLLLGDDPVDSEILSIRGVHRVRDLGIPLVNQLALVAHSDGFMGMASGIAAAAVLSNVPYVLFKHPEHHVAEMERELGEDDHFRFASPRQYLWRVEHTPDQLKSAMDVIAGIHN